MKDLFITMFLLDNWTKPENITEILLYILLYLFWIPFVLFTTFILFPIYIIFTPFRRLSEKLEEDALNESVGRW